MSTERKNAHAWVEVDLGNLLKNAQTVQAQNPNGRLLPMVKADAYGLGALPVIRALESLAPWGYGVATIEEAVELRKAGVKRPIVVFTPALQDRLDLFRAYDIHPVLEDPAVISDWKRPFHLEIDTGMGRSGIPWHDREAIAAAAASGPESIFMHFHSADESPESVRRQLARFDEILHALELPKTVLVHVANSAGSFVVGNRFDLIRPGVFLYGGAAGVNHPPPEQVAALFSRVVSLRRIRMGETVSYGAEWMAHSETTIATLSIGYADGVRRRIQGKGYVMIGDRRFPVVGRVTMDMTLVDVGGAEVSLGDVATVFGGSGEAAITLDEFAGWAGTISYEILTGLGRRLPRVYMPTP
jgi:alanine racemase